MYGLFQGVEPSLHPCHLCQFPVLFQTQAIHSFTDFLVSNFFSLISYAAVKIVLFKREFALSKRNLPTTYKMVSTLIA